MRTDRLPHSDQNHSRSGALAYDYTDSRPNAGAAGARLLFPGAMDSRIGNCVITPYGRGAGSARVRVFEWLDLVETDFLVSSYLARRDSKPSQLARRPAAVARAELRLREIANARPKRLLLHREASPLSGGLERRLITRSDFAVYDFDDALQWDYGSGGLARRLAPKAGKALARWAVPTGWWPAHRCSRSGPWATIATCG